ncbi:glycosyltransferase [Microbacterium murale]|uniref:Glycosyltransferase 2-like domain-containing protein n=1 Tax=Microbacterium murale TaxID=1081040 RepID=A0ABU0PCH0_9MICO|nr:glycosyltransferase [Microbacterium murale]MDQ0645034.1 hypothetical protein [Microbacterium murale]
MSAASIEVIIACHDPSRPLARAVSSLFQDVRVRDRVRAVIVAHGTAPGALEAQLTDVEGDWQVVPFSDGVRSPAGPFNHGLRAVRAEYCAVMGSDDYLEPGAMEAWLAQADESGADAVIAPIRLQGESRMPNPLVGLFRERRLDASRDRLFYRTAPLGIVRTQTMRDLGLTMAEGVRVGEDFEFGIRLWSLADRVDFARNAPCYVIGTDAKERTTYAPLSLDERFEPITRLLDDGLPQVLTAAHRRALAIKLVRISVLGAAHTLSAQNAWRDDDEVIELAAALRRLLALAPRVLEPFNLQNRRVLDALLHEPTISKVTAEVQRSATATRWERWATRNPLYMFHRESMLRRYALYWFARERKK